MRQQGFAWKEFKLLDSVLTRPPRPLWQKDPRIANLVMNAIYSDEKKLGFYSLPAFAIMPNSRW